jgi:hypothetical protein
MYRRLEFRPFPRAFLLLLGVAGLACTSGDAAPDTVGSGAAVSDTIADGSVGGAPSLEQALADFRVGLPVVTELRDAEPDRERLVRRFARAVERADTAALRAMVVSRAEFAWLYYPTSPYTRRPTRQNAALAWELLLMDSQKGVTRLLDRYGGRPLHLVGHTCAPEPQTQSDRTAAVPVRFWYDCTLRLAPPGADTTEIRLFGPIMERDGRFKLFSYSNDL